MNRREVLSKIREAVVNESARLIDYRAPSEEAPHCLLPIIQEQQGLWKELTKITSVDERAYLIGYAGAKVGDRHPAAKLFTQMTEEEATGEAGKKEMLRRIDFLLNLSESRS